MNIFIFHKNLTKNARCFTDKHLIKMIVEQTQLLCNAYYVTDSPKPQNIYRPYNLNHPATQWVTQSKQNWLWLHRSTQELLKEYTYRFEKTHRAQQLVQSLCVPALPDIPKTPHVLIMPIEYRQKNALAAYRAYLLHEKQHTFTWTKRKPPHFIKRYLQKFDATKTKK